VAQLFPEILTPEKADGGAPVEPGQQEGRMVTKEGPEKPDQPMRRPAQIALNGRTVWKRMTRLRNGAAILAAYVSLAVASAAAEPASRASQPAASVWTVTLGVKGHLEPVFPGAGSYEVLPYPVFNIRRAGTPEKFSAPRDNIAIALYDLSYFRVGVVGKVRRARDQSDDPALNGLGNVPWAGEVGGFAEYWWARWLRGRAEVRQGFGGHHGIVSDLSVDGVIPLTGQLTFSGGPRMTLATAAANDPYYSITPFQSYLSGLPVYDAKGGVQSVGAGVQTRYLWNEAWTTFAFAEYQRLTGGAANSPLVEQRGSPNQFWVGIGTSYSFNFFLNW
jgi:outer membrane protein